MNYRYIGTIQGFSPEESYDISEEHLESYGTDESYITISLASKCSVVPSGKRRDMMTLHLELNFKEFDFQQMFWTL